MGKDKPIYGFGLGLTIALYTALCSSDMSCHSLRFSAMKYWYALVGSFGCLGGCLM